MQTESLSPLKRRIRFTISYDGTGYHGWQLQPDAATIQGCLEQALESILTEKIRVTGAGRTDAGVHALGQVAHFDTTKTLPVTDINRALNAVLPAQIRVREVRDISEDFHARYSALWKLYRYQIAAPELPDAVFLGRTCWLYSPPMKLKELDKCCEIILGEHDFFTFSKKEGHRENHLCHVFEASWKKDDAVLSFEIKADRFLRGMVRMLVGGMLAVAENRAGTDDFRAILDRPGRWKNAVPAPACGLALVSVEYPDTFQNPGLKEEV